MKLFLFLPFVILTKEASVANVLRATVLINLLIMNSLIQAIGVTEKYACIYSGTSEF